ncbi:unnamed protein product, partial [Meganyctiphanes norvegica]
MASQDTSIWKSIWSSRTRDMMSKKINRSCLRRGDIIYHQHSAEGISRLCSKRFCKKNIANDIGDVFLIIPKAVAPLSDKLRKSLTAYEDFVVVNPGAMVMPHHYQDWHQSYQDFQVQPTDVWVASYPKAGTTWTQEMVWCILNKLDFEGAKAKLMIRFPFFEWETLIPKELPEGLDANDPCAPGQQWRIINSMPSPRTIKTHLHMPLLPSSMQKDKPKIIYVTRDPRDVCTSYYYHSIKLDGYQGEFSEFVDFFLGDTLPWSPFWSNVLGYWAKRHEDNVLFIRYEEMKEDLSVVIKRVSKFLSVELNPKEIETLEAHLSFSSMSKNKAVNNESIIRVENNGKEESTKFMRKGQVGDWKNHLTKEQQNAFKEWTIKHLIGSDFPYYQDYK